MHKSNNICCCVFSIIASLLAGAGIAALFVTGLLTSVTSLVIVTLILGILGLLYVIFTLFCGTKHQCNCIKKSCLVATTVGSIVTSIFALTASSLPVSISVAIFIGVVVFFLVSNLISLVNVILCKSCGNNCCED